MIGEESLKDGEVEVGLLGDWDHANEMIHEDGCQDSRSVCELSVIPLELYSIAFIRAHGRLCPSIVLRNSEAHKQGLRDDMKSLYYVVLYSGICWLPHDAVENLGVKMKNFFSRHELILVKSNDYSMN